MCSNARAEVADGSWPRLEPALVRFELAEMAPANMKGEGLVIDRRGPVATAGGPNLRSLRGILIVDEENVECVCVCLVTVAGVSAIFLL
jgi:hypothetical protein